MEKNLKESFYKTIEKFSLLLEILAVIVFGFSLLMLLCIKNYYNSLNNAYIILSTISATIIVALIFIDLKKNIRKIENIFLHAMLVIGTIYLIFMIPTKVPDEVVHMYRAYEISNGFLMTKKDENGDGKTTIPISLDEYFFNTNNYLSHFEELNKETNYNETKETHNAAQGYSFLLYIPASIAFLISRIFNFNIVVAMYLARLFNFLVFILARIFFFKNNTIWEISSIRIFIWFNANTTSNICIS